MKKRRTGIALAPGAAAELIVDAPALVTVGAEDVKTAEGHYLVAATLARAAETDVRAAPGHVGRDGHRSGSSGLGHDLRLLGVVPGVEHPAADSGREEVRGQPLRLLDAHRADQDRPAGRVHASDLIHQGLPLRLARAEDHVRMVDADRRPVGRHRQHVETVDLGQLGGGGPRGARHAA